MSDERENTNDAPSAVTKRADVPPWVRQPHPWENSYANYMKLKAARAERKRIYERTSPIRNDERFVVQNRERARKRLGLPIDGPKMKPGRPRKVAAVPAGGSGKFCEFCGGPVVDGICVDCRRKGDREDEI
jgi:hypothetical protein